MTALIIINGRLHTLRFLVDGAAVNVTEQRVEDVAGYLLARHHVEIAVIGLDISETLEPFVLFQPSSFFLFDLTHTRCGLIRKGIIRRDLVIHRRQTFGDEFVTQSRSYLRATIVVYPIKKGAAV